MTMPIGARWSIAAVIVLSFSCGCRSKAAHGAEASTSAHRAPASRHAGILFHDASSGFSLRYPPGWSKRQSDDKDNVLVADAKPNDPAGVELTVAVPKLPAHIPGFIPLEPVQSGYVDDLKKRMQDVTAQDEAAPKVSGARGTRRFTASGKDERGDRKLDVVLLVKGDRLYIVTAEAPAKEFDKAKLALDQAVATWKWTGE